MSKFSKGFTLIELIVVIAIIAILAAIVMVNVVQYIARANDSSAKEDLNNMMTSAIAYYATNDNYAGFLSTSSYTNVTTALSNMGYSLSDALIGNVCDSMSGNDCSNTSTKFCYAIAEKANPGGESGVYYCVDSSGGKFEGTEGGGSIPSTWYLCNNGSCQTGP